MENTKTDDEKIVINSFSQSKTEAKSSNTQILNKDITNFTIEEDPPLENI